MIKGITKITVMFILTGSIVFCGTRSAKTSRIITGKSAVLLSPVVGENKRAVFEERYFSTQENDTIKKRSHKRRRKVRRPREGR